VISDLVADLKNRKIHNYTVFRSW